MKKKTILGALCLVAAFISGNLAAQTQPELHEQVKGMTEVKNIILNASFEDDVIDWTNDGFWSQGNDAFLEKTGNKYCEKWRASPNPVENAQIYQTCNLPNGQYVLAIDAKASNDGHSDPIVGFYFVARDGEWDQLDLIQQSVPGISNFTDEDGEPVIAYYISLTVTNGKFTVGMVSENANANYVRFDNVRLFTSDPIYFLQNEIREKANQLFNMLSDLPGGYDALLNEDGLYNSAITLANNSDDVTELTAMGDSLTNVFARAEIAKSMMQNLFVGFDLARELTNLGYSGKDTFEETVNTLTGLLSEPTTFNEELEEVTPQLKEAIKVYNLTGATDNATEANPFEVTFMINSPQFSTVPDFSDGDISVESTQTKGEWLTTNVYSGTAMDNKLNFVNSKNCWNNWSETFYSLDLHQTLTDLPEGVYSLSMITATNGPGNARAYASSTSGTVYSPIHTVNTEGDFRANGVWEGLTTTKVYVAEGDTLRIGMSSSNVEGNNTAGWFCATDFRLYYYGEGNANQHILVMKLDELQVLNVDGTMTTKALQDLNAVIAKVQDLYDNGIFEGEQYTAVLAEADSILPLTKNRVAAYTKYYKVERDALDFALLGASNSCELIQTVIGEYERKIQQDETVDVADFEQYAVELDDYMGFANTFMTYEEFLYKDEFLAYASEFDGALWGVLEYVGENGYASLEKGKKMLEDELYALFEKACKEGEDITYLVSNPGFEENTGASPIGWTNKGFNITNNKNFKLNGTPKYTGENACEQWVDDKVKHLSDIQVYQTVKVPNGKYTVTVDAMCFQQYDASVTDITGFYLVAKNGEWGDGSDLTKEQVLHPYKEITVDDDTIVTYSVSVKVYSGKLTFGMVTEGTNANWVVFDAFRITLDEMTIGVEDIYNDLDGEAAIVYTEGRRIVAPEGATVYSSNGMLITATELLPGAYFVRVGSKTYKVMIP